MKTKIKDLPKFSVEYMYSEIDSETITFPTLKEARKKYDEFSSRVLDESNSLEARHWRNNKEGLSVELRELREIPIDELENLRNAENEDELQELWTDILFTYSVRLKTKYTYLSDEWGDNNEYIIKENEVNGITYGTYIGAKPECIPIEKIKE